MGLDMHKDKRQFLLDELNVVMETSSLDDKVKEEV